MDRSIFQHHTLADHKANYGRLLVNHRLTGGVIDWGFHNTLRENVGVDSSWVQQTQLKGKDAKDIVKVSDWMLKRTMQRLASSPEYAKRLTLVKTLNFLNTMGDWKEKRDLPEVPGSSPIRDRKGRKGLADQALVGALLTLYLAHGEEFTISTRDMSRYTKMDCNTQKETLRAFEDEGIIEISRGGLQDGAVQLEDIDSVYRIHSYKLNISQLTLLLFAVVREEGYELFGCNRKNTLDTVKRAMAEIIRTKELPQTVLASLPQKAVDACLFLRIEMNRMEDFVRAGKRNTVGLFKLYNPDVCSHGSGMTFSSMFLVFCGVYKSRALSRILGGAHEGYRLQLQVIFGTFEMPVKQLILIASMATGDVKERLFIGQFMYKAITKHPKMIARFLNQEDRIEWERMKRRVNLRETIVAEDYPGMRKVDREAPRDTRKANTRHVPKETWAYLKKSLYVPTAVSNTYIKSPSWPPERKRKGRTTKPYQKMSPKDRKQYKHRLSQLAKNPQAFEDVNELAKSIQARIDKRKGPEWSR